MSQGMPPADGDALEQLRELIVGPEREDLADLRRIVTDPGEKTHELSKILPHAVRLSTARDAQLSESLAPTIESALKESVKKDPTVLTDVVFPIIGPAIRRAIADAFSKMVQSMNQSMEHSFSVQGLKWRLEAKRTGKSFAEVVLSRTLLYRVEQVFLIHKESGLLLAHARAEGTSGQDADMVSGMLTAIQDFMHDAFRAEGEGLRSTQYGDYNVWLESNRRLTLAAFIRGSAPEDFRTTLQDALDRITIDQNSTLKNFHGDATPFEESRPVLESCLQMQRVESSGKMSPLLWIAPLLLVLGLVGLWEWRYIRGVESRFEEERLLVSQQQRRHAIHREQRALRQQERDEEQRLAKSVRQLNAEEGIVVTDVSRRDGIVHFTGLRDPLAPDPQTIIAQAGLATRKVTANWQPYFALTPGIVLKRAEQRLKPPAGAKMEMRGETLVVSGSAPGVWVDAARKTAETIPGIAAVDMSGVLDVGMLALTAKKKEIDDTVIYFGEGLEIAPNQEETLKLLATRILEFREIASALGRRLSVAVNGHTTELGGHEYNLKLSRNRADRIVSELALAGVDAATFVPVGLAAREAQFTSAGEDDAKNRRVTFSASFDEKIQPK
jgi:outer membrane protein OmpA-like peptidoglycan-associated protein